MLVSCLARANAIRQSEQLVCFTPNMLVLRAYDTFLNFKASVRSFLIGSLRWTCDVARSCTRISNLFSRAYVPSWHPCWCGNRWLVRCRLVVGRWQKPSGSCNLRLDRMNAILPLFFVFRENSRKTRQYDNARLEECFQDGALPVRFHQSWW